ncbi:MAG: cation diffusion facilitator CzcD-associated flavoprotein CzcO [Acidimicrobiales bacterium]|jgi:cation diffusion facilitator CzcD-associated flavoprotein CzcO
MAENLDPTKDKPQDINVFEIVDGGDRPPQEFYDDIKAKYAEQRELRLGYRPPGSELYQALEGDFATYETDPNAEEVIEREAIVDEVEVLFIGGGFSALLTSARLRERGVESIRIVEKGSDVGGTWYWNRYPGVACDVVAYDYLPLLDEMEYVPTRHYAGGPEIFAHCQAIARKYDLYDLAVFQTTVTSTVWHEDEQKWHITTDRGDQMKAKYVICANGTLSKPRLAVIDGMETFEGESFHTSRWDYEFTGADLEKLKDVRVGIIGTGASAVQIIPNLGANAKELYVFQRTPSSIDVRDDWETDPEWAKTLEPGWQGKRRTKIIDKQRSQAERSLTITGGITREEKIRRQENANIDAMMRIHKRIDEVVDDASTAEALKPWYMIMCKRPCFHNDYLPAYNLPNVELVDTKGKGITEIGPKGPIFEGTEYEVDLLIYATGFEVQKTGIYNQILGEGGLDLNDKYEDGIRTLLGIHSQGYPNMFVMGGYQASFQFNLTDLLQVQGDHIANCIAHARDGDFDTIDVTAEAEDWWVQEVIAHRGKTKRNQECTPGYYNFEGQENRRQDGNYNGGFARYVDHIQEIETDFDSKFVLTKG